MNTNLATIQIISDLQPIPNADSIETASMKGLGWKCVVKKGEFKIGDSGVYIQIDTVVPEKPEFEFLRKNNFRIKTIRLRKQLSQGLLLPLSILPAGDYKENDDVTEVVGVKHYEKPIPFHLAGMVKGTFPSSVHKTDEIMLQSILPVLDEIKGKEVYITVKCDGTSATFIRNGDNIDVCSRNLSLKETDDSIYWKIYHKYHLDQIEDGYAVQGELCGPGIQKNNLGLTEHKLFVFNVYDIKSGRYLGYYALVDFCSKYNLEMVPVIQVCKFDFALEQLLEMAKGKYDSGKQREGIVIRSTTETYSPTIDEKYGMRGRMSFKVLNNEYLEKEE